MGEYALGDSQFIIIVVATAIILAAPLTLPPNALAYRPGAASSTLQVSLTPLMCCPVRADAMG